MEFHPVANIFPLMDGAEFASLVQDIKEQGLREAISLHRDGSVIDGRNRYRACMKAHVPPRFETFKGSDDELLAFVISMNLERRHLNSDQRATCALSALEFEEARAHERQLKAALKGNQSATRKKEIGTLPGLASPVSQKIDQPATVKNANRATERVAKDFGTNRQYVSDAKKLRAEDPEAFEAVKQGTKKLVHVKREKKEQKREQRRAENRAIVAKTPIIAETTAHFATIVIDPPWDWSDEGDADQLGRARPTYDTMTIQQITKLPVGKLADIDCHLYLWITNRSLPKGFDLLDAWGFRYVTCLTWCKPSFGMGNYFRGSTEHVLFGVRGSQPLRRRNVGTWFEAPRGRGGHSSKPAEFFTLVESCSPGPYLEMFARSERSGWTAWGAET